MRPSDGKGSVRKCDTAPKCAGGATGNCDGNQTHIASTGRDVQPGCDMGGGQVVSDDRRPAEFVVGLLADPDLPARLAQYLREVLPADLCRSVDDGVEWRVEVRDDPFEAMYPDYEYVVDKARAHVHDTEWDLALCLTDLPLRGSGSGEAGSSDVLVAYVDAPQRVALISLPALGGLWLRRRLRELTLPIVAALRSGPTEPPATTIARLRAGTPSRATRVEACDGTSVQIVRARASGVPRLLAGMVRANRPWQLIVGLSTALAGALAGTAFGVLYSTIWQLATAMGPYRLAGVTLAALTALIAWIITRHRLWERPQSGGPPDPHLALRNAGTLATVAVGAVVFFAALFLLTQVAVALVVPPDYLSATLGRPVDWRDYPTIALMASVLGTVAGAVGSGLEDDRTVRKATYGYREQERRQRVEQQRRAAETPRDP